MKKVTAPNVYPLFLAKHFVPTKVGQLLEDPTLGRGGGGGGGGGSNYVYNTSTKFRFRSLGKVTTFCCTGKGNAND